MNRWRLHLLAMAAICPGCSRSMEIEKYQVTGTVTYNSSPVERGEIRFVPQASTKGPLASGMIAEGNYTVTAAGGVPVGVYRVEILGYVELPRAENAPPMAPTPREQYIPAEFNTSSELEFELSPQQGLTVQDFELEGPPRRFEP